jgi:nicotinamide mononucleotide transporter
MLGEIAQGIWAGLAGASLLDRVNLALGIAGVVLMVRRSLWAFPVGLVAVTVQGVLFFGAKFYADAALQIFFFGALGWGWWNWTRANDRGDGGRVIELPVTRLAWSGRVWVGILVVLATVIWALAARRWTDAVMPWRDAFIAMAQVAGQVLQARKQIENWAFFTVANVVAIPAYFSAELAFTALLFGVYLVLGLLGWRAWWLAEKRQAAAPATEERT